MYKASCFYNKKKCSHYFIIFFFFLKQKLYSKHTQYIIKRGIKHMFMDGLLILNSQRCWFINFMFTYWGDSIKGILSSNFEVRSLSSKPLYRLYWTPIRRQAQSISTSKEQTHFYFRPKLSKYRWVHYTLAQNPHIATFANYIIQLHFLPLTPST